MFPFLEPSKCSVVSDQKTKNMPLRELRQITLLEHSVAKGMFTFLLEVLPTPLTPKPVCFLSRRTIHTTVHCTLVHTRRLLAQTIEKREWLKGKMRW